MCKGRCAGWLAPFIPMNKGESQVKQFRRRRLFADPSLQGRLCLRVALYWCGCLLIVSIGLGCLTVVDESPQSWSELVDQFWGKYRPVLILSLLAMPLALFDCLVLSNRYAGPLLRLRRAMKQLADAESVAPLSLRERDLLQELVSDFNRTAARLQESTVDPVETRQPNVSLCDETLAHEVAI